MFNKEKILEIINQDGFFIDQFLLDAFIKNWKIEAIYEDENGVEYFDEMTIEKIKNGISQKNPMNCEVQIIDKNSEPLPDSSEPQIGESDIEQVSEGSVEENTEQPDEDEVCESQPVVEEEPQNDESENIVEPNVEQIEQETPHDIVQSGFPVEVKRNVENNLQNVTVDISNQTLAVLAESIARKITSDVSSFLKESDFVSEAVHLGEVKKDNEILITKIEELLEDNKILVQRIEELESENDSYVKLFGNVYIKNV